MKKLLSLVLAIMMLLTVVSASAELDTSEQVEIIVYMMGDKPQDCDMVMEKVNEILLEKLNCTMSMKFVGWADWATAYNLLLTGGDPIDLIYSASWASDSDYARKGAFMDLTDLVEEYAPELWDMFPIEVWDYATITTDHGDMLYCIPTAFDNFSSTGIFYRADLCEKYNIPAPTSIENATAYQQGIKDNCPEMIPNMDGGTRSYEIMSLDRFYLDYNVDTGIMIGATDDPAVAPSWTNVERYVARDNEAFLNELRVAKDWADKGFWDRNLAANPIDSVGDYFNQGSVAMSYQGQNVDKWAGCMGTVKETHPDWKVGFIPYGMNFGYVFKSSPIQDATAVPITARYPERALAVVQEIYTNPELLHLISYGIEGVHYTLDEVGNYTALEGAANFGTYAMNTWAWKNSDLLLEGVRTEDNAAYYDMKDAMGEQKMILASGFTFDTTPVETELAAVGQVFTQYLTPLRYGLTNDLEADVAAFFDAAEAAGLLTVQDEYIRQYTEFCEENGIK